VLHFNGKLTQNTLMMKYAEMVISEVAKQ
jgi:hypothetical protein